VAARGVHDGPEQVAGGVVVSDQLLRMPLDGDREGVPWNLGPLDDPVGGVGDGADAFAGDVDRLVMEAIHLERHAAQDLGEA
jgi:hypothetical protein